MILNLLYKGQKTFLFFVLLGIFLLFPLNTFASDASATIISKNIENFVGEVPEVDGLSNMSVQNNVNSFIKKASNELIKNTKNIAGTSYSFNVYMNKPSLLSLVLKSTSNAKITSAKYVNIDLNTATPYKMSDFFIIKDDFFNALEKDLGWRPDDKTDFALSQYGIVFYNKNKGQEQTVEYYKILDWVLIGKANEYLNAHKVTSFADGKNLRVKKGDIIIVFLESNRSTGYTWSVVGKEEGQITKYLGTSYLLDSSIVGAGGWEMIVFGALEAGNDVINMEYKRNWESKSIQNIKLNVIVDDIIIK